MADFNKYVEQIKYKCNGYMIEPLFKATGEYRLHCTRDEVFFMVKKIKRNPEDIIITHENHHNVREFPKPRLLKQIEAECLKAMQVLDLDIACFDVMYDSSNDAEHRFTIAEANTNPELLRNTFDAYTVQLNKLIEAEVQKKEEQEKVVAKPVELNPLYEAKVSVKQKLDLIRKITMDEFEVSGDSIKVLL